MTSWGIGEIPDLPRFTAWLDQCGLDFVLLAAGQRNGRRAELAVLGNECDGDRSDLHRRCAILKSSTRLAANRRSRDADRVTLDDVRRSPRVTYDVIRDLKSRALARSISRFEDSEWATRSTRARAFQAFREREAWWLADYCAVPRAESGKQWTILARVERRTAQSAARCARRRAAAARARDSVSRVVAVDCRRAMAARATRRPQPVAIFGDFPFVVSAHSADVWARQHEFRLDASVGTPPDAFSATGQDWGLPLYRWDVIERSGYEWLQQRARRSRRSL